MSMCECEDQSRSTAAALCKCEQAKRPRASCRGREDVVPD